MYAGNANASIDIYILIYTGPWPTELNRLFISNAMRLEPSFSLDSWRLPVSSIKILRMRLGKQDVAYCYNSPEKTGHEIQCHT